MAFAGFLFARLDGDGAAPRHGVARVDGQVQHRHFELVAVDQHRAHDRRKAYDDADVRAQRTVQQVGHVVHQVGNGDCHRIQDLPAGEGQHALSKDGAPLGGLYGVGDQRGDPGIVADTPLDEFQAAQHHRQQVVEVVRDAAGQLADGVHLLRLEQRLPCLVEMLLGLSPLGEIARDLREAQKLAGRAADRVDDDMRPEARAVLAHAPALGLELAGALGRLQRGRRKPTLDVLVRIEDREVLPDHFMGGIALEALGRPSDLQTRDAARGVEHVNGIVGDLVAKTRNRASSVSAALSVSICRSSRSLSIQCPGSFVPAGRYRSIFLPVR